MDWLARNAQILEEIASEVRLAKGEVRGKSGRGTVFYSAGRYQSQTLGAVLHLGVKLTDTAWRMGIEHKLIATLAFISAAQELSPELIRELPLVYGLLIGPAGEHLGYVTEDFTQNGVFEVLPFGNPKAIPEDFKRLVIDQGRSDWEEALTNFFYVRREGEMVRRLGDLESMGMKPELRDRYYDLQYEPHTLTLDYQLE